MDFILSDLNLLIKVLNLLQISVFYEILLLAFNPSNRVIQIDPFILIIVNTITLVISDIITFDSKAFLEQSMGFSPFFVNLRNHIMIDSVGLPFGDVVVP